MSEFAAFPDDVPVPPPTDPADDPTATVRVEDWARRLDPTARRWIKVAGHDPWPWVQFSGIAWDPDREGPASQDSPWRTDAEVAAWPVTHLLSVAIAFRHADRGRAASAVLDKADAEGAAPFRDAPP